MRDTRPSPLANCSAHLAAEDRERLRCLRAGRSIPTFAAFFPGIAWHTLVAAIHGDPLSARSVAKVAARLEELRLAGVA